MLRNAIVAVVAPLAPGWDWEAARWIVRQVFNDGLDRDEPESTVDRRRDLSVGYALGALGMAPSEGLPFKVESDSSKTGTWEERGVVTLAGAIKHANEKGVGDGPCAEDHRRLATWLVELQTLRAPPEPLDDLDLRRGITALFGGHTEKVDIAMGLFRRAAPAEAPRWDRAAAERALTVAFDNWDGWADFYVDRGWMDLLPVILDALGTAPGQPPAEAKPDEPELRALLLAALETVEGMNKTQADLVGRIEALEKLTDAAIDGLAAWAKDVSANSVRLDTLEERVNPPR